MFGRSLHLDLYGIPEGVCDDLQLFYDILEELPKVLGMSIQAPPYIFRLNNDSPWPDKAGLTGFVPLVESGISVHTLTPKNFCTFDVYTCGELGVDKVLEYLTMQLQPTDMEFKVLERGLKYDQV